MFLDCLTENILDVLMSSVLKLGRAAPQPRQPPQPPQPLPHPGPQTDKMHCWSRYPNPHTAVPPSHPVNFWFPFHINNGQLLKSSTQKALQTNCFPPNLEKTPFFSVIEMSCLKVTMLRLLLVFFFCSTKTGGGPSQATLLPHTCSQMAAGIFCILTFMFPSSFFFFF